LLAGLALLLAPAASRAGFVIVNLDGAGEGFNDATPVAPVGGNTGTTVGQQRLNVFVKAGQLWDAILGSPVQIRVQASFDPLPCTATSGVLGGAGPNVVDSDFAGAPFATTWYNAAEANRLAGSDLDPADDDIGAQFNVNVARRAASPRARGTTASTATRARTASTCSPCCSTRSATAWAS
jgi:hypothetical protein